MSRLPQPGGDKGNWGDILNDFLTTSHNPDGTLKDNAVLSTGVEPAGLSDGTKAQLTDTIDAGVDSELTARGAAQSGSGFLTWAGTVPGSVPVVKASTDTRAAVWEMTHNSTNYIFHLLAGSSFTGALIAMGLDNGTGAGLLVANKSGDIGILINQEATLSSASAFGIKITQQSANGPSIHVEQNVDGAADALQLFALNASPTAGQLLLNVNAAGGQSHWIDALHGRLWTVQDIVIRDNAGASQQRALTITGGTNKTYYPDAIAAPTDHDYVARYTKNGILLWSDAGANNTWSPFGIAVNGSHMRITAGTNVSYTGIGYSAPAATGALMSFQNGKLSFFNATEIAQKARIGALTDLSGGVSGGATIAAVTDSPSAANAIATLTAKVNALEALLSAAAGGFGLTA